MENIKQVILLEGGNEYKEGRDSKRSYRGRRTVGSLYKHSFIREDAADAADAAQGDEFEDIEDSEDSEE